uniref:E2 ubiquitin-conjugating enzyme n=1 Tax=Craspedostauros australis TaxID=1486917 RepID=A0A7R9WR95_9STRA|mmetsp:Transcript_16955/g.46924  ORF Transcript_16955/g.46924 Transcript_16955/m.46924 type:complete len:226 (+) Transcript_16955:320-997(+)
MVSDLCTRRLTKELASLRKDPMKSPRIVVAPNEANILEMHYVIEGSAKTPYEGGIYHGKLIFPKQYPLKPPGVIMLTPTGRFQPNRRLCLSMSDFHPETWNPMWSVSTILTGLYSFMIETSPTLGSIETTTAQKRRHASQSLEYNMRDVQFRRLFPEYVELHNERQQRRQQQPQNSTRSQDPLTSTISQPPGPLGGGQIGGINGAMAISAGIIAILSLFFASRFY